MTVNDIIILPFTEAILEKTAINTIRKYKHVAPAMMYKRTPVEMLDNIFMGDLAKNSLLTYLRQHCIHPIADYDETRSDNFMEKDPGWDFKAGSKLAKTEVKSSIPTKQESRESIIAKRDIKITASHDKGKTWTQPCDLDSELHVQVFFYAEPVKKEYADSDGLYKELSKDHNTIHDIISSSRYREPLFFGWNTKKTIIHYSQTLTPPSWTFDKTSRIYWRCPIKEAQTLPQLIEFFNNN